LAPRAEARCRISLFTARLLWAEASLGGRLGAAFLLMQCVCGFAAAFGCRRPAKSRSVQINQFIRTVGRFCRYKTKKSHGCGKAKPLPNNT